MKAIFICLLLSLAFGSFDSLFLCTYFQCFKSSPAFASKLRKKSQKYSTSLWSYFSTIFGPIWPKWIINNPSSLVYPQVTGWQVYSWIWKTNHSSNQLSRKPKHVLLSKLFLRNSKSTVLVVFDISLNIIFLISNISLSRAC